MEQTQNQTELLDTHYNIRDKSVTKLKKSGIVFPYQPVVPEEFRDGGNSFKMPDDITILNSMDLGRLLSLLTAMLQWYGAVLASARVDRDNSERVKNYIESKVRMSIFENKELEKQFKAREDKEAYVNIHEEVIKAQIQYDTHKATCTLIEQLYNDLDRAFKLTSREISRRSGEFTAEVREVNIR